MPVVCNTSTWHLQLFELATGKRNDLKLHVVQKSPGHPHFLKTMASMRQSLNKIRPLVRRRINPPACECTRTRSTAGKQTTEKYLSLRAFATNSQDPEKEIDRLSRENTVVLSKSSVLIENEELVSTEKSSESDIDKTKIVHEGRGGDAPYPDAKDLNELMRLAWADYKFTWVGFFNQNRKDKAINEEELRDENGVFIDTEKLLEKQKELRNNVDRNVETIKEGGGAVLDEMKEITGIHNNRDLKKWAMEQLKLANECVGDFMKGYREGRDEEVDKMMNEYFKDIDFDYDDEDEDEDVGMEREKNKIKGKNVGRRRRRAIKSSS